MPSIIFGAILLVILIVFSVFFYTDLTSKIDSLEEENSLFESQIDELISQKTSLQTQLNNLSSKIDSLEEGNALLEEENSIFESEIDELISQKTSLQTQLNNLSSKIDSLEEVNALLEEANSVLESENALFKSLYYEQFFSEN